jgi:hypothetical protein
MKNLFYIFITTLSLATASCNQHDNKNEMQDVPMESETNMTPDPEKMDSNQTDTTDNTSR